MSPFQTARIEYRPFGRAQGCDTTLWTLYNRHGMRVSVCDFGAIITSLQVAGNAGTQSLAVAVRKLTNKSEEDVFFKSLGFELLTGAVTGVVVGVTIAIIAGIWKQNLLLGCIIGIAMAAAIFVANLAGSLIPKGMVKLGFDPAVASGPFISTLSDLTSVLIYFSIAQHFITQLMSVR